jgi:hypothetical protein
MPWAIATPLTITFVVLKLIGVIDWSWWWVFSPLWIAGIITGIMFGVFGGIATTAWLRQRSIERGRTWVPKVAGILSIIAGAMALWAAIASPNILGISFFLPGGEFFVALIFLSVAGTVALTGGIVAVRRKAWGLALAGAIAATWFMWPLGVPSIIMVAISKKEFRVKEAATPAQQHTMPIILPPPMEQQPTMNFCPECGHKVTEQMAYCPNCGRKLSGTEH